MTQVYQPPLYCQRCELPVRIEPKPGSKARLLKRAKTGNGLCVHCAVHDWLRNTYPVNLLLAESGPKALLVPDLQEQFAGLMRQGNADAVPDEINWARIVEFWNLPFATPVKQTAMNPAGQRDLDEIAGGKRAGLGGAAREWARQKPDPLGGKMTIDSFEDLNLLDPGAGDELRDALHRAFGDDDDEPDPPKEQKRLFD